MFREHYVHLTLIASAGSLENLADVITDVVLDRVYTVLSKSDATCFDDLTGAEKTAIGAMVESGLRKALHLSKESKEHFYERVPLEEGKKKRRGQPIDVHLPEIDECLDVKFTCKGDGWMIGQTQHEGWKWLVCYDDRTMKVCSGLLYTTTTDMKGLNPDNKSWLNDAAQERIFWLMN